MIKEFNSLEEIKKYYDKKTNTYIFKEDDEYIDLIKFNFDLSITSNIKCKNIYCRNIKCRDIITNNIISFDIKAHNIYANTISACDIIANDIDAIEINGWDINAKNIIYYRECFAFKNIKCKSIEGNTQYAKHHVYNGTIEIKEE